MSLRVFDSPHRFNRDIFYANKNQTVVITSTIDAENAILTITAKNVILLGRIQAKELHVNCDETFATIGMIDAERQVINTSDAFIGGYTTTEESEIIVKAFQYPSFNVDEAREKIRQIIAPFFPAPAAAAPVFPNCRLEALMN
jgi:hypothetical protein